MRKLIVIFCLLATNTFAQFPNPLPSSGSLSINEIATWMRDAGEISQYEFEHNKSLDYLNSKSHLSDKTAPFSISDWYGYSQVTPAAFIHAQDEGRTILFETLISAYLASSTPRYDVNQDVLIFYEWTSHDGLSGNGSITIYEGEHSAQTGDLISSSDHFTSISITFITPSSDGVKTFVAVQFP